MTGEARGELPGLRVHRASRVEALLDPLVDWLRTSAPEDPFTPITIVVQSRGMQRWLSHQLAERLDVAGGGIAANLLYPFPRKVIDDLVQACRGGEGDDHDPWSTDRLSWHILEVLSDPAELSGLEQLAGYLGDRAPGVADSAGTHAVNRRAWQLAYGIADVFDRYALYRPEMAAAWSRGESVDSDGRPIAERDAWQPRLWQLLVERVGDPTQRLSSTMSVLQDLGTDLQGLPSPLLSFGISGLPPRHLDVLTALASRSPVHLYVPTASAARWEAIGQAASDGRPRPDARHPLLVSCGRLLDDAAELILEAAPSLSDPGSEAFAETPGEAQTLLAALQRGIRGDLVPSPEDHHLEVAQGRSTDPSVQVHVCHGPARQVEVLRDALLGALADDETLQPRDLLIMTPDIDTYAPLVQAAFVGSGGIPELPVTVADRHVGRTNPVADALLAILDLAGSRATASQVLDVLSRDVVLQRFGLSVDDLDRIQSWVAGSGIRWGIDADHRQRAGQPAERVHTWRFGLDRLLLGAVMADEDHRTVGDVTPYDDIEGGDVELVGRFAEACTTLFDVVAGLSQVRDVAGWVEVLTDLVSRCMATAPADRWRMQEVRVKLEQLRPSASDSAVEPALSLDLSAIIPIVEASVSQARGAAGYETGAATLCALVPMRSIPHRVVCLLGMDDRAFPRRDARLGFDLLDRETRVGDRDGRAEDRSLFLEALLAARETLLVTTTGHDVRTGEDRPPAVPLAELLDVLDRTAQTGVDGVSTSAAVTVHHPLQPFSPRNFGDGGNGTVIPATSFDPVSRDAADATRRPSDSVTAFLEHPLAEVELDGDPPPIELATLKAAVLHPTRFLLERRLGLRLREFVTEIDDHEPLDLSGLDKAILGRMLLDEAVDDERLERWQAAKQASGTVPAGTPGVVRLGEVSADVELLRTEATLRLADIPGATLHNAGTYNLDIEVAGRHLVGEVDGFHRWAGSEAASAGSQPDGTSARRVLAHFVRPRPAHLLEAWIDHLALTADGVTELDTWVVARGKDGPHHLHLGPLDEDPVIATARAVELLTELLEIYDDAQRRLLPLLPKTSHAFVEKASWKTAYQVFEPNEYQPGSGDRDEYTAHVYGDDATLHDVLPDARARAAFDELSRRVWGPPLEHAAAGDAVADANGDANADVAGDAKGSDAAAAGAST